MKHTIFDNETTAGTEPESERAKSSECEEKLERLEANDSQFDKDSKSNISTISTPQRTQSCVAVRCGTSWVMEFRHGGVPPFALRNFPSLVRNFTSNPEVTGSHSMQRSLFSDDDALVLVCTTFLPVKPNKKGSSEAVRYLL